MDDNAQDAPASTGPRSLYDDLRKQEETSLVAVSEYVRLAQGVIESLHKKAMSSYDLDNAYARLKEADMWIKQHGHAGRIRE